MTNGVCIKTKGRDEMFFPDCGFENCDSFIVISFIENNFIVGAFSKAIIEYVYYRYFDHEHYSNNEDTPVKSFINEMRSGIPKE